MEQTATSKRPDRRVRTNRARILDVARQELSANPDVSMDDIARASGVVRRTLYGHFPGREALLDAVADEADEALRDALDQTGRAEGTPEADLGRQFLALWAVGDRFRMLITLARHHLGDDRFVRLLLPARERMTALIARGQRDGAFSDHLPARTLAQALEALTLSLLESINDGTWQDPTASEAASAALIAVGVAPHRAAEICAPLSR